MEQNECLELVNRLRIDKSYAALSQIPAVHESELFSLLYTFHVKCAELVDDLYFPHEFDAECRGLHPKISDCVQGILGELTEETSPIFIDLLYQVYHTYSYWWPSSDLPPSSSIVKTMVKEVYRSVELLLDATEFPEFKRLLVRLSRDFGIQSRKVQVITVGKERTFRLVRSFFKQTIAFNDFERSLRINGLISEDTRKAVLRAAFKDEGMSEKVVWTGTIAELSYLVKGLIRQGVVHDPGQEKWKIALGCFEVPGAEGKSMAEVRRSLREAKRPNAEKVRMLDVILGHFG